MPQVEAMTAPPPAASGKRKRLNCNSSGEAQPVKRNCDLDLDILECPICSEPFSLPVYQCQNGHPACSRCCKKLSKGCPSCQQPIGTIRCITIEKIVESLLVSCKYAPHGCKMMLKCTDSEEHEKNFCTYVPEFHCPVPECTHEAARFALPIHLTEEHNVRTVQLNVISRTVGFRMEASERLVMVEGLQKEMFLVHREAKEPLGEKKICTSFGVIYRMYELKVSYGYTAPKSYSMADVVGDIRLIEECRKTDFLFFPIRKAPSKRGFDILLGVFPFFARPAESDSVEEDSE